MKLHSHLRNARPLAFAAAVPLVMLAPTSHGQEQKRQVKSVIEEVTVTAQKREESVNDVPIAISAFTGDSLKALGVVDTRDLGKLVPGFNASENGYNTPVYTLRGVGFNDTTYTATSTVGVYVDEVSLPYSIMTKGANLDLARVEVLKGPQGTLFGRNTTGGAINYVANKPTEELEGSLSTSYGKYQTSEIEAVISGPLSDTLGARVAVKDLRSGEGWQHSITRPNDTLGEIDKQSFRGILEWSATEDLELSLTASGWRDRSDSQAAQPVAIKAGNPFVGDLALAPQVRNHPVVPNSDDSREADWVPGYDWRVNDSFYNTSLRADWYLDENLHFVSLSSYGKVESDGSKVPGSGLSVLNSEQIINASVTTVSQEFRLHSEGADVNWVLGANYSYDDGQEDHITYVDTISLLFPDPITGQATVSNRAGAKGDTEATTTSIFFSADWVFSDAWMATLGARYSDESRDYQGCSYEPNDASGVGTSQLFTALSAQRALLALAIPDIVQKGECFTLAADGSTDIFTDTLDEDNVAVRAVLTWTPSDTAMLYASFVQGYKSGGYPVLNGSDQKQLVPVTQEKLLAYEIGSKTGLLDDVVQLNLAAFYYDYSDKQLLTRINDAVFGPLPILQNAPKSHISGAEVDLQIQPTAGLFISLAASYIASEIDEFESFNINGDAEDFSGRPFNFSPNWQGTALVDYSFPISTNWDMGLAVDYSYTSETNSTIEEDPNYAHDDFGLLGARLRLVSVDETWTVVAAGRNLTNEYSTIGVFQIGDSIARYTGQPRTYSLSVNYAF
ncbi:MAG: TonB-dependent receptor [Zhongshania sp.]|nr:TonB-dependent receptor [Zhongshania sp.]